MIQQIRGGQKSCQSQTSYNAISTVGSKQRDKSIDIAKGIGIILVVYGHLACPIHEEIYLFHMPLFFLLSGYFFSKSDSIKHFFLKKTKALICPFLVFYIVSFIYFYLLNNDLADFIGTTNYFLPSNNGTLWFLLSLYGIFVITFAIDVYILSVVLKFMVILMIIVIGYIVSIKSFFLPLCLSQSFLGFIFFYLGYQIRKYNLLKNKRIYIPVFTVALISYCLGILLNIHTNIVFLEIDRSYILFFLPALGGSLLVIYFSRYLQDKQYTSWLAYLGKNSLLIMCVHMPLISLSNWLTLPVLKVIYYFMGNTTATNAEMMGGRICGLLSLIVLVPLSLYIGLLIKKIFPFCFSK